MADKTQALDILPRREFSRANGSLYKQLATALRSAIQSGSLSVGDELPREADLADHYSVSLITVRQALRDLEVSGLIRKRSAKPAVVTAVEPRVNLSWNYKNFTDIAMSTKDASLEVKSYRREESPIFQQQFAMKEKESGYCLRSILHGADGRRTRVTTYFPPDIGKRIRRRDFKDPLIFRSIQAHLDLKASVAAITVRAEVADEEMALDLAIPTGSAVLTVEMAFKTKDGRKFEYTIAQNTAENFSIAYEARNDMS